MTEFFVHVRLPELIVGEERHMAASDGHILPITIILLPAPDLLRHKGTEKLTSV
jgi:hypothetical protein